MRERVGRKIRPSSLSLTRAAGILLILTLTMSPSLAHVSGTKPPPSPPPSTSTTWAKAYNIPYDYAAAYSVSQLSSGGYVVGASCTAAAVTTPNCNTLSEPTAMVMRVDSSGNIQSQTQYDYLNYPYSTALDLIRPASDGGAIFAGNAQFNNDLQFSTSSTYGPVTWPLDLQQTTDGGYVVAGYAFAPASSYNPFVVKLSSNGQIQWQRLLVDPNSQYSAAYAVRQTTDGGYVVAGEIYYNQILVFKLDSTGNPQFAKTYAPSGSISDLAITGAQQTTDGGYAFAGYYFQNTIYNERAWLVKTDSTGKVQWDKIYGADVQYS